MLLSDVVHNIHHAALVGLRDVASEGDVHEEKSDHNYITNERCSDWTEAGEGFCRYDVQKWQYGIEEADFLV